jgi:cyclopropane fatty-acyl-phospholipid synthase-like methyltransferase
MSTNEPTLFERMQQRYRARDLPWDHELPPPEIMAVAERLAPGRLIDLGCGTARASVYLAARGWDADAIDFVPEAIDLARERVRAAGHEQRVRLHVASVTDLSFLADSYDLAIDVGCFHGLSLEHQRHYVTEVTRLIRSGGTFLLFAHLRDQADTTSPASTLDGTIEALFAEPFHLAHVERGQTIIGEMRWDSAWYTLVRR